MSESRTSLSVFRRFLLPLLIAAALVVGTVLFSGSALLRIEDVTINRILAGTYGTPDWRVQEMNPLLAQLLSLLYRVVPSINWYGGMLLGLLLLAAATGISLTARKRGGLIPAVVVSAPIVVLLTNSMFSTAVCALSAVAGALSLMEGIQRKKDGAARAIWGGILFSFALMISLPWAVTVGIGAAVCWLPCSLRESRVRGVIISLPIMAILAVALFGYSSLMYNAPELAAYRSNYALYERLQHSSLKAESDALLAEYGVVLVTDDHADHDHDGDGVPDGEAHEHEDDVDIPQNSFDSVGWTINDSSLFFTRYSSDTKLTDPETLRTLEGEASFWDFSPGRIARELFATIRKPQFLMLIALFIISALAVLITSRRRGLVVLLAAILSFGGHIVSLARYYDAFADIAPFYLLGIGIMLYYFSGEDAKEWFKRVLTAPWLRIGLSTLVLVVFVAAMSGLLYYTKITPANASFSTVEAVRFIKPYIAEHPNMLFIGENPNERFKPQTLAVPARGEDQNLLAGSYDLYSPRKAVMMEKYGIENPLPDCVDREDIGYVVFGFTDPVTLRLISEYDIYMKAPTLLLNQPDYSEGIVQISAYTAQERAEIIREETAAFEDLLADMAAMEDTSPVATEADTVQAPTATPSVSPSPVAVSTAGVG